MNILDNLARRIKQCAEEVDNRNRGYLVLFSQGALLLALITTCMSMVLPYYRWMLSFNSALFIYNAFLFFLARYCQSHKVKHIRAIQYLFFTPLIIGGVLVSSVFDPTHPGVTFIIFICILPLFMIDNPWRMAGYQIFFAGLFVLLAYYVKPGEVFMTDVMYLPVYMAYIMGANIFALMEKVSAVEDYLCVRKMAEKDTLTKLFNRTSGETQVTQLLKKNVAGSFAILDIDDFKMFNDRYGHQLGDEVLCKVSEALHSVFRSSDILWRLGGDEFAVYAVGLTDKKICQQRFAELKRLLAKVDFPQAASLQIQLSVGCIICTGEELEFNQLYKISDEALYEAKNTGKGKMVISCI